MPVLALLAASLPMVSLPQPAQVETARARVRIVRMVEVDFSKARPKGHEAGRRLVEFE